MGSSIVVGGGGGGGGSTTPAPNATADVAGLIKIKGALSGTYDNITIPELANKWSFVGAGTGYYSASLPSGTVDGDWKALGGVFAGPNNSVWFKPAVVAQTPNTAPVIEQVDGLSLNNASSQYIAKYIDANGAPITGVDPDFVTSRALAMTLTICVLAKDQANYDKVLAWAKSKLKRTDQTTAKNLLAGRWAKSSDSIDQLPANGGDNLGYLGALIRAWNLWGRATDRDLASLVAADIKNSLICSDEGRTYLIKDTDQKVLANGHHTFNSGSWFQLELGGMNPVIMRMAKTFTGDTIFDTMQTAFYHALSATTVNSGNLSTTAGLPPEYCCYDTASHSYYPVTSGQNGWTETLTTDFTHGASRVLANCYSDLKVFTEGKAASFLQGTIKTWLLARYAEGQIYNRYTHTGTAVGTTQDSTTYIRVILGLTAGSLTGGATQQTDTSATVIAAIRANKLPTSMSVDSSNNKFFNDGITGALVAGSRDANGRLYIDYARDRGLYNDLAAYGANPNAGTTSPATGGTTTTPTTGNTGGSTGSTGTTTPPASSGDGIAVTGWHNFGTAPNLTVAQRQTIAKGEYTKFKNLSFVNYHCNEDGTNKVTLPNGQYRVMNPFDQFNGGKSGLRACVSEGIGYGMLATVFWGNPKLDSSLRDDTARTYFDGFYKYYKQYPNKNGFMQWCITSKGDVNGVGGASDGDFDVAFALLMAHRIWGSTGAINYGQEATTLINKIRDFEFVPANHAQWPNVMMNGDEWGVDNDSYFPDYFRPAWFREFYKHTGDSRWLTIINVNYPFATGMFYGNSNGTGQSVKNINGLKTDARRNGERGGAPTFNYNSIRYPFSLAADYCWNGTATNAYAKDEPNRMIVRAKAVLGTNPVAPSVSGDGKLNPYSGSSGIVADPALDYSYWNGDYRNATYVQAYGVAGIVDAAHAQWAADCMTWLQADTEPNYFGRSLSCIATMLMAGIMTPATPTTTGTPDTTVPVVVTPPVTNTPTADTGLYVDSESLIAGYTANISDANIKARYQWAASKPQGFWTGDNPENTWDRDTLLAKAYLDRAQAAGKTGIIACYNIPNRDAGQFSAGGAANVEAYKVYIQKLAVSIGNRSVIMCYEADAAVHLDELGTQAQKDDRIASMRYAIQYLKQKCPNLKLYIDAGHSAWKSVDDTVSILKRVGVEFSNGFSCNVSNFRPDAEIIPWAQAVIAKLNLPNMGFIYDTSRNGNPNGPDGWNWCNPAHRRFGKDPKYGNTGVTGCDGWLWIKRPGESDGAGNNGAPGAGNFWPAYLYNTNYGDNNSGGAVNDPLGSSGMLQRPPVPGVAQQNANGAPS